MSVRFSVRGTTTEQMQTLNESDRKTPQRVWVDAGEIDSILGKYRPTPNLLS